MENVSSAALPTLGTSAAFFLLFFSGGILTPGWSRLSCRFVSFCRSKRLQQCWNEAETLCCRFPSRTKSKQSRYSFLRVASPGSSGVAELCVDAARHQPQHDTVPSPPAAAQSPSMGTVASLHRLLYENTCFIYSMYFFLILSSPLHFPPPTSPVYRRGGE